MVRISLFRLQQRAIGLGLTWSGRKENSVNRGHVMFQLPRMPAISLLAIAACAGIVLAASEASACSTTKTRSDAPTCCVGQLPSACGCCGPARTSLRHEKTLQTNQQPGSGLALSLPEVPDCECRPTEPTAASSKPESRPTEERPTEACHDATLAEIARPTLTPVRRGFAAGSLSDLPLYLRTARLLI
jgi:hypothetical protein